ncbi:hypothetical protein BJF78_29950, partial [Pseudonocardia sp. CNS-139]
MEQVTVAATAAADRRGTFTERGYRSTAAGLGDLLGWERFEARRRVVAAEHVCPRTGLDGAVVPARLPATAVEFGAGRAGLRHVEVIARLLASPAASRLALEVWAGAETELAAKAGDYTPTELQAWGTRLIDLLDQDGPDPDHHPAISVNELRLLRFRNRPGGRLQGRFDDPALFDAIAVAIDARSAPADGADERTPPQRQAQALAEVCAHALDTGRIVARPHLNVTVRLEELEGRCRAAVLDFGGAVSAESLRMLACDAAVIPIVMNGNGQPLDVGRMTRTIPDGLRRAVAARAGGCEFPGCDRPPSWCEVHH